jgi:hypothetical protein
MLADIFYFLVRHIPFWAIPMALISAELIYLMWKRDKKKVSLFFSFITAICLFSIIYYYVVGGPLYAVRNAIKFIHYLSN